MRDSVKCSSAASAIYALKEAVDVLLDTGSTPFVIDALQEAISALAGASITGYNDLVDFLANESIVMIDDGTRKPTSRQGWKDLFSYVLHDADSYRTDPPTYLPNVDTEGDELLDDVLRRLNQLKR